MYFWLPWQVTCMWLIMRTLRSQLRLHVHQCFQNAFINVTDIPSAQRQRGCCLVLIPRPLHDLMQKGKKKAQNFVANLRTYQTRNSKLRMQTLFSPSMNKFHASITRYGYFQQMMSVMTKKGMWPGASLKTIFIFALKFYQYFRKKWTFFKNRFSNTNY